MRNSLISIICLLVSFNSYAVNTTKIVANIGDQIITSRDVFERGKMLTSCLDEDNCEQIADPKQLQQVALEKLIDERLILEEAERLKISISDQDLDKFLDANPAMKENLNNIIKQRNLSEQIVKTYIKSHFIWNQIIEHKILPKASLTENEVKETLADLNPDFAEITFKQIMIPLANLNEKTLKEKMIILNKIRGKVTSCGSFEHEARNMKLSVDKVTVDVQSLQSELRDMVKILPIGAPSKIIKTSDALHLIVICARSYTALNNEQTNEVSAILQNKKIKLEARRYLQDLRKKTFIEIKGL